MRTAAFALVLVGLAGCGGESDEDAAGQAAVRLANAMGAQDAETSCGLLTEPARARLAEEAMVPCAEILPLSSTVEDERILSDLRKADIERVDVDGSRAVVRLEGTPLPTVLREVDDDWLVDELAVPGFRGSVAMPDRSPIRDTTPALTPAEVSLKTENLMRQFDGAGFEVSRTSGDGAAIGEVDVRAEGGRNAKISVYVLPSADRAARFEQELNRAEKRSPDQVELGLFENVLVVVLAEDPADLPADQFALVRDVVVASVM